MSTICAYNAYNRRYALSFNGVSEPHDRHVLLQFGEFRADRTVDWPSAETFKLDTSDLYTLIGFFYERGHRFSLPIHEHGGKRKKVEFALNADGYIATIQVWQAVNGQFPTGSAPATKVRVQIFRHELAELLSSLVTNLAMRSPAMNSETLIRLAVHNWASHTRWPGASQ